MQPLLCRPTPAQNDRRTRPGARDTAAPYQVECLAMLGVICRWLRSTCLVVCIADEGKNHLAPSKNNFLPMISCLPLVPLPTSFVLAGGCIIPRAPCCPLHLHNFNRKSTISVHTNFLIDLSSYLPGQASSQNLALNFFSISFR